MILYLHGFASCGDSNKSQLLKSYFGEDQVLSPDLPTAPAEAISFIKKLIIEHEVSLIIGSSLGGYYASYFAELLRMKAVLINPSTEPFITLASFVGTNHYWCNGEAFEFTREDLKALFEFAIAKPVDPKRYLLLLQTGDELLDYKKAAEKYAGAKIIIEEGGNHRFENLKKYLKVIKEFKDDATHR